MSQCCASELNQEAKDKIYEIIAAHKDKPGLLIPILHEVQEFYGYLPFEVQKLIAEELNIPLADIYGVVTFYSRFSLTPVGKYKVGVCMGTACYVKGSDKVLEEFKKQLGLEVGETSEDGMFSLEATRCIGACGLAPVITVNEDVYGKLFAEDVKDIVEKYK